MGSTETTFYVLAVYLDFNQVRDARHLPRARAPRETLQDSWVRWRFSATSSSAEDLPQDGRRPKKGS